jgi:hypothetical protein
MFAVFWTAAAVALDPDRRQFSSVGAGRDSQVSTAVLPDYFTSLPALDINHG